MGMVTDNSAARLEGVSVSAQISDIDSARVVRTTLTDDGVDDDNGIFNAVDKGKYKLLLSPDTSFNIVVFSEAKVGDQMYSPACEGVVVPVDHDVVKNLSLEKSDFGSVSGTVMVTTNNEIDPENPPAVYVSFYADLSCGYVEIKTLPVSPDTEGNLEYIVDLPLGNYDVVASAEGFIPDTGQAALNTSGDTATVDLNIIEQPGI